LKILSIIPALLVGLWPSLAQAGDLKLGYQIFAGGFDVGHYRLNLTLEEKAFRIRSELVTAGMVNFMTGFSSSGLSEGDIQAPSDLRTRRNRTDSKFMGKPRWSTLDFPSEGPAIAVSEPPAEKDDRDPVSPELTIGTVDLLTAGLIICRFAAGDVDSPIQIPVFDGRRRFNLEIKAAPVGERFKPISSQYYSGPALRLDVTLHRVAGYVRKPLFSDSDKSDTGQVWFLPPPADAPGFALPVRLEMDSFFGAIVIHLLKDGELPVK
jgi:hypothetical protein